MKKGVLLAILMALIMAPCVFAEDDVWQKAKSPDYGTKVGGMLGRGLVNVATCFVDLIVQTVNGTKDGPPFVGTMTGLGGGLGCTALRVTSGALDVLTFWVPGFNGAPVSKNYNNCLEEDAEAPKTEASVVTPVAAPVAVAQPAQSKHDAMDYVKK